MRVILWLQETRAHDGAQVGTKALNLADIALAGFPVPPGFCVTAAAYEDHIAANGLDRDIQTLPVASDVQGSSSRLQEAIRAGHISVETRSAILSAYRELLAGLGAECKGVAVRSSASAEDLPTASFAGQQTTWLNVQGEEELLRAILDSWASLWSPRAVLYRARQGLAHQALSMGVLVQVMMDAEAAGVAFSEDPTTGADQAVVEAAWGLGEGVVSGATDADHYVASRETQAEIEPPSIAHKLQMRIIAPQGGPQTVEVPDELQDRRVLTAEQVSQVTGTVLALEQHFGCPQDMEWALSEGKLYVLQSRPITTSRRSFFTDILPKEEAVWTSGFLNERFPLPVSPLGWSVVRELLEELAFRDPLRYLGMKDADQLRITRLYRGHPYVNVFVFQTLYKVFPRALLPEDACRYFPEGKTDLRLQVRYPRSLFDPRFVFSMARQFVRHPAVWSPWHNYGVWAAFSARHERCSAELEAEFEVLCDGGGSDQDIWAVIEQAQGLNAALLALHRWSLTFADLMYTLLRRTLQAWAGLGEATALCSSLVAGLPNRSLEVDHALRDLALAQHTPAFGPALAQFLARYGHRSFYLDIEHPSFADDPTQVIHLLQTFKAQETRPWQDHGAAREQAERDARRLLGGGALGWLRRALFEHVLHLAQRYLPLREEQRFYWQRTLALMRRLFLLLGQRMAAAGTVRSPEDVFMLTKDEIGAHVRGRAPADGYAALAAARQQEFARLRREFDAAPAWSYPPFLRWNQPLEIGQPERQREFRGRAVSPGLARGRVVVLFSAAEFHKVRPGDVLVTRAVDPGWTPIFGLLSALVMEHGGQLSHAAVVAREYGLPTVAGILGITQLLHTGDMVLVDGLNGRVARLQGPSHTTLSETP